MSNTTNSVSSNFNDENISLLIKKIELEKHKEVEKTFTMVHSNSYTNVNVSEKSREICAKALLL